MECRSNSLTPLLLGPALTFLLPASCFLLLKTATMLASSSRLMAEMRKTRLLPSAKIVPATSKLSTQFPGSILDVPNCSKQRMRSRIWLPFMTCESRTSLARANLRSTWRVAVAPRARFVHCAMVSLCSRWLYRRCLASHYA